MKLRTYYMVCISTVMGHIMAKLHISPPYISTARTLHIMKFIDIIMIQRLV